MSRCKTWQNELAAFFYFRIPSTHLRVFPKIMVPQNGWFIRENHGKPYEQMDDLGYHYFWKHPFVSPVFLGSTTVRCKSLQYGWGNSQRKHTVIVSSKKAPAMCAATYTRGHLHGMGNRRRHKTANRKDRSP